MELEEAQNDRIRGLEIVVRILAAVIGGMQPSAIEAAREEFRSRYDELGAVAQLPGAAGGASRLSIGLALGLLGVDVTQ